MVKNGSARLEDELGDDHIDVVGTGAIDPDAAADVEYERNADGSVRLGVNGKPRKKRGRKAGSGNPASAGTPKKAGKVSLASPSLILMAHVFLAQRTRAPELMVTENEAQQLANAINDVASHYPNVDIDPVLKSWLGLAFVAAGIYGPRVMAARQRLTESRRREAVNPEQYAVN